MSTIGRAEANGSSSHTMTTSHRAVQGERGVGLMEVIVATIIAVIAIVALAYTFGMGRGLVNRYDRSEERRVGKEC